MYNGAHVFAQSLISLMLRRAAYDTTRDYRVGDCTADLLVQLAGEPPFIVQVLAKATKEDILVPDEAVRERFSKVFCAPVYFAVVLEGHPDIVELEPFLIPKVRYSKKEVRVSQLG